MAVIKCKMCGGELILTDGSCVAECEYCGSKQTVPTADNEKKMNLFARANRLRAGNEFDKAAGIYESIVSDFSEEAEAYWGLVLCKYGIEYVDDPATGKKVPTCHRSSFDSVMDDANFELVMEYADPIARRVYREEAKQLEELRKGIVEVSSHEEPYDVFICYKETDEDGQRTLDSVLAQDVYDMLTENGYRVFFSRVSLEDKLGVEYEPYIFAALNSAKIMLAFGTDYDYYNAVWVKNEWSRFLQLIARGEKKTLIPCYKNIDAYDMPKEFAKLQAQDLGKVGAMQDLLRGVKKILPKEEPKSETAPQVVVQQAAAAGPTTANLLRRGSIFLEEKNWSSAESYFNKVLDIEAENGGAYLGLALAKAQCSNLDMFIQKRSGQFVTGPDERLTACAADTARIGRIAQQLEIPGYLSTDEITKPFGFDLSYPSGEKTAKENKARTMAALRDDRNFTRAKQYAHGTLAEKLTDAERQIEAACDERVKKAENAAARAKAETMERYKIHLDRHEFAANVLNREKAKHRENDYQAACAKQESAKTEAEFLEAEKAFAPLRGYKDAKARTEQCANGAKEVIYQAACKKQREAKTETEFLKAEKAFAAVGLYKDASKRARDCQAEADRLRQQREANAKREAERKAKKKKKITILAMIAAIFTLAVVFVVTNVIIPSNRYKEAEQLLNEGKYEEAVAAFETLCGYKDSAEKLNEIRHSPEWTKLCPVGDSVYFGSYEQDNDISNGEEEVEWIVLVKEDKRILVISRYALECKPYNLTHTDVTWETCTLREWLNSDFLNATFTAEERNLIPTVTVTADKNPKYDTSPGNVTQDKVFLLSIQEGNKYFVSDKARECAATDYAVAQGAYTDDNYTVDERPACMWRLRSPGYDSLLAAYVDKDGSVFNHGSNVHMVEVAIRPALWINLGS